MRTEALERMIRRASDRRTLSEPESCALCATGLPGNHPHMLDTEARRPLCVCQACSVLFHRPAASEGRYRLVPDRRVRLAGVAPAHLGVPVGLAFFVLSDGGEVTAHYPSPAGATRWEVDGDDWQAVTAACPPLGALAAEVEALLVNTAGGRSEAWIVPISDCYRLVGVVRQEWQGLSGGERVWKAIEEFFSQLRRTDGADTRR